MSGKLPQSLTVEDAVARMMNLESVRIGSTVIDFLNEISEGASLTLYEAEEAGKNDYHVQQLKFHVDACRKRTEFAWTLKESLAHEVRCNIDQPNCISELASDSTSKESLAHEVSCNIDQPNCILELASDSTSIEPRLTLDSVAKWAMEFYFISIPTHALPVKSSRSYKSTYLDILDHAVAEHWDGVSVDGDFVPKNDYIKAWIDETYPAIYISAKVADSMCTIIRPDKFMSIPEQNKMFKK